ncbi:MAG: hypothetical protein ACUVSW_06995 [Roseiflexus sp.]
MTKPVRRGNCASGKVALTFDIEIDDTTLYAILDVMRQRGVKGRSSSPVDGLSVFPMLRARLSPMQAVAIVVAEG